MFRHASVSRFHLDLRRQFGRRTSQLLNGCSTDAHNVIVLVVAVPYSITSVGNGDDPGFLAVSPQVTLVINLVVGRRYFPPGPQ